MTLEYSNDWSAKDRASSNDISVSVSAVSVYHTGSPLRDWGRGYIPPRTELDIFYVTSLHSRKHYDCYTNDIHCCVMIFTTVVMIIIAMHR